MRMIKRQRRVITSRVFRFVRESLGRQLSLVVIEGCFSTFAQIQPAIAWLLLEQSRNQITPEASFAVGDVLQAGDHQHEIWLSVGERVDRASPAPYLPVESIDRVVVRYAVLSSVCS